ncbi:uncharacterized protein EV154DRAFT_433599 [Mucor mucedo]|uniref:uncharacterized protein n=1 Tax=Mucor mucedo TaxID=29922 RepID=UPI00222007F0|nr:uncharacterized protein EV154DRAFT_433599 [Mucor mucedo]KAI7897351.1 hypothetical protein EV154DRAFT_433599 [Mucor mucedo]
MNVSALLNPVTHGHRSRCVSSPVLPVHNRQKQQNHQQQQMMEDDHLGGGVGKPRSRFSEYEDNIIRNGVAQRLTWGQISDLLPHRKRATCFNRYRTLQGIRKSRKQSSEAGSPVMTCSLSTSSSSSASPSSPLHSHFQHQQHQPIAACLALPPLMTNSWSTDIIYPMNNYHYADIQNSSSCDSSSDEEDQLISRISLPAITRQPYYNL